MATMISQPQTNRTNSRLRGPRITERLNLEIYSMTHDLYKLYYKQSVIEDEILTDINYVYDSNADTPQDLPFDNGQADLTSMTDLLARVADLRRRVSDIEFSRRNEL